ncbi:glycoside hydrolase family 18 protein [Aspergillus stella-maris]|uniref:glycoside hydrolase family 18 protein n=1 Tax=Aspergillus stella-maris TaxID=1810926 RepID=UPI003CCD90CF
MYLTGQHNVVPELALVQDVTHVALAFMRSDWFNTPNRTEWPLFTSIENVRAQFAPGTAVMVAIGGWGDTSGFDAAARTEESRALFAENVRNMLEDTGADGVDIDWEYPGGNGEDYKQTPNSEKAWEIEAYPHLLSAIRTAIGPNKIMSAAVPGLERDMLAFTSETIPLINPSLDFYNIMTYDLMNRRDSITKHHTGIQNSLTAINAYTAAGVPAQKANLGFAFYVKWFKTDPNANCNENPLGCRTVLMEDPSTGADLGQAGAFSWIDAVPGELSQSFERALNEGEYDSLGGGYFYFDPTENIFWSFDTPEAIVRKVPIVVEDKGLSGVFAWGLGEDAPGFAHLQALTSAYAGLGVDLSTGSDHENPFDAKSRSWFKEEL